MVRRWTFCRFLVELLGHRRDRLDHVLRAIENDKKLSRTNEVDQLQAGIFRFECKSQGCRDSRRNMTRIGEAFQVNKIDFAAKLFGGGAAYSTRQWSSCQCRRGQAVLRTAHLEACRKPRLTTVSRPIIMSGRTGSLPWCRNLSFPLSVLPCERDDGADERIAPSLDVCDVSVAKLAVTKRLADRGHVDPEAPLLNGYVRPDVIDELLLRDDLTRAVGKIDQNIQRPIRRGEALDRRAGAPSRQSKVRKGRTSASCEPRRQTCVSQNDGFPRPRMPTVGRQTPQLCARKVSHNEARSLSHTFGKDELNLGIAQSPSTRRVEAEPRAAATTMTGRSSMRRHDRPALRVQSLKPVAPRSVSR